MIEREPSDIGLVVTKLRPYLLGRSFLIEIEHCPLCNFHKRGSRNRRVDWWPIILSEYDITEIKFKKGTLNCDCDLLSWYPVDYERLQELLPSLNVITRAQSRKNKTSTPASVNVQATTCSNPNLPTLTNRSPLDINRIKKQQQLDDNIRTLMFHDHPIGSSFRTRSNVC